MKTTLRKIASSNMSNDNWNKLVTNLGCPELVEIEDDEKSRSIIDIVGSIGYRKPRVREKSDDIPNVEVSIRFILEINGFDEALLSIECVKDYDREKRLLAVSYAKQVKHLMRDGRSLNAIEVAERYANGLATDEELNSAKYAAWDAASAYNPDRAAISYTWWVDYSYWAAHVTYSAASAASDTANFTCYGRYPYVVANSARASVASFARLEYCGTSVLAWDAKAAFSSDLAANIASSNAKELQTKEFSRMLDCIENGQVYNI